MCSRDTKSRAMLHMVAMASSIAAFALVLGGIDAAVAAFSIMGCFVLFAATALTLAVGGAILAGKPIFPPSEKG
jgi:hypothetical protein